MNLMIFCGKGGVGKTLSAVSLASHLAGNGQRTAIIDTDGGHSVQTELGKSTDWPINKFVRAGNFLDVAVIERTPFTSIGQWKEGGKTTKGYLSQFGGDQGIVPFADMISTFFGVPTDTVALQNFAMLVSLLVEARERDAENIVIDVEPTAGLEKMLLNAQRMAQSLKNLQKQGVVALTVLGARWPDIKTYLKGDYISNAEMYTERIQFAVSELVNARYFLVCTPRLSPVQQTSVTRDVVQNFGGKIHGYVINSVTGAAYEERNLKLLPRTAPKVRLPVLLELEDCNQTRRMAILREQGAIIHTLVS